MKMLVGTVPFVPNVPMKTTEFKIWGFLYRFDICVLKYVFFQK